MPEWERVRVGDYVTQRIEPVELAPNTEYSSLGIRYRTGVYVRDVRLGQDLRTKMYRARAGDFIYCILDTQRGPFDVVPEEMDEGVLTNKFPVFEVKDGLDPQFLRMIFTHEATLDAIGKARDGSDGRSEWKPELFEAHEFLRPPLSVQRQIVKTMTAVDEAVRSLGAEADALLAVLRLRRAELISGVDADPVRADKAFDIRLGRQRSPERATGPSMTQYMRSANVGYDKLRMDDVLSMDFNEKERERYRLLDGDVLVSEGSASPTAVGMPAVWHDELEGPVCFQNTLLRYRAIDGVTIPAFVRHWCLWAFESGEFRETAGDAPGVRHIGAKKASAMAVRLPDLGEQEQIAAVLDPMADAVAALRSEAQRLLVLRGALLEALLAGEVDLAGVEADAADGAVDALDDEGD